jgi:DNA-binding NtrC family response regulator
MNASLRILLVEDDPALAASWKAVLELDSHEVFAFDQGRDAFDRPDLVERCDLLVTDYYLPDVNGLQVIEGVRALRPGLPVILLTGAHDRTILEAAARLPRCAVLRKPVRARSLVETMQRLLAPPEPEPEPAPALVG